MGKVAIKIILRKNVKGNEEMVYQELNMLQTPTPLAHCQVCRLVRVESQ